MSWFNALPAGASTRQGNLDERERSRAEIEAERLLKKQKSEQMKAIDKIKYLSALLAVTVKSAYSHRFR